MRDLVLHLERGDQPVYLKLAESLRQAIESEQLGPDELLPSTRSLARQVGVHRHTVMNALSELVAEGWLESEPGRGYRVVSALPRYFAPPCAVEESTDQPEAYDYAFPSGLPDLRLFPTDEYYRCLREVLREVDPEQLLGYGPPSGQPRLLGQLEQYLRRLRDVTGQALVVTSGSQEGIFLLGKMLLVPGQLVAVEEMGYTPAWEALRLAGGRLVGIPVDEKGLVPEALDALARLDKVKLLYLTPLHQYPTTVTMTADRRRDLYEVCSRHRIRILEDDYDHEFHYRSQPIAPLKSRDPEQLVYYTSTFSKVVYPSARLGFVALSPDEAGELARLKKITSRQNTTLIQETMAAWMERGGFERHLRKMRRTYYQRMQKMVEVLQRPGDLRFTVPDGGMSLWVDFGVDSQALARRAAEKGVEVRPGASYRLEPGPSNCLRLGFASSSESELEEGLGRLLEAARELK